MVFSGIYPVSSEDYEDLREALRKLALNDSFLTYEPETSAALGFGFDRILGSSPYGNRPRTIGERQN